MLGLGKTFDYEECADCGSVQICEPPADMECYYPKDYYSFNNDAGPAPAKGLKGHLIHQRDMYLAGSSSFIGRILWVLKPNPDLAFLRMLNIKPHYRILDVGCGRGALLSTLAQLGYRHLLGADPFVAADIDADGFRVRKVAIKELERSFDLIMFHHSLEHVTNPVDVLRHVRRLLSEGGKCLVRVPTTSSDLYAKYGPDWVNLDAPRHFVIPSRNGMSIASERAGLRIVSSKDDSGNFSYWASEQYRRGVTLHSARSYQTSPADSDFTPNDIERFSQMARDANARQRGDWVQFVLTRN